MAVGALLAPKTTFREGICSRRGRKRGERTEDDMFGLLWNISFHNRSDTVEGSVWLLFGAISGRRVALWKI